MSRKPLFSRKKLVLGAVLAALLISVSGFVWGHKNVQVIADGNCISVSTMNSDPVKILKQAGVVLEEKDEYRLSTRIVEDHTAITVYRAVPVRVTYKGKGQELLTGKPTVGELMAEMGLDGDQVKVSPARDTKITKDVEIKVVDITEKITERSETENFEIVRQPDATMERGQEEVAEYGENGEKIVKVREHFEDGVKVSEEVLEENIIKPARPQVIKVGARDTVDTSRGAMRFKRAVYMEATAYLPSDGNGDGITATGMVARHGVVAVDPNVIPLGTRLYIPGYGVAVAGDTGGAIRGNIIDLCMENYGDAINFGRRGVKVYILE